MHVTLETAYDATVPLVSAVPAEVGRVPLNLFQNAFYAVRHSGRNSGKSTTRRALK
ncbi:hypothetical protein H8B13_18465 [Hymenobacter sp. BT188]|uniref:hypothetical protein n=1 Tax=Hymenobacter sp. BT188 TaxID=2763504 RepID=UPI0016515866|nr:hypothetical protein [Hymenobacter sp. BT188]MBC6608815.1 hypothetical protein [Hymenobacter sp. BT188]